MPDEVISRSNLSEKARGRKHQTILMLAAWSDDTSFSTKREKVALNDQEDLKNLTSNELKGRKIPKE